MRSSLISPLALSSSYFTLDPKGDLNYAVEFLRQLVAGSYVVPGMNHRIIELVPF